MAFVARSKPTVSHRKRRAEHHRHNKHYLKPYWPYLPVALIIGGGIALNNHWPAQDLNGSQANFGFATARMQQLAGNNAGWLTIVILLAAVGALSFFTLRHSLKLHRALAYSERFVNDHPLLDIALAFVFMTGFVLGH